MADYTELKGIKVKYLDSDPSPGTAGDVWYNTTTGQLKSFLATTFSIAFLIWRFLNLLRLIAQSFFPSLSLSSSPKTL